MPNQHYFGGTVGLPTTLPSSSSHGNALKGVGNGHLSPSPPPHLPNRILSSKLNGSWMNLSVGEAIKTQDCLLTTRNEISRCRGTEKENDQNVTKISKVHR
jgi:hypothetical protein